MKTGRLAKAVSAMAIIVSMFVSNNVFLDATQKEMDDSCRHNSVKQVVKKNADEAQEGVIEIYCQDCSKLIDTKIIHAYKTYYIDSIDGEVIPVQGWLESDYAPKTYERAYENGYGHEILVMLNQYRSEYELNALKWNEKLQEAANLRALEAGVVFSHTRPNGENWYTVNEELLGGENLAIGYKSPEKVMAGWKSSESHNDNLLYSSYKAVAVGVFHMYLFDDNSAIPRERIVWSQSFSY